MQNNQATTGNQQTLNPGEELKLMQIFKKTLYKIGEDMNKEDEEKEMDDILQKNN